jgi:UDP-N-acetylglucosamine--N-acetylmuramyl-(pentapeptide) pyrophosphoryl-undecaprenol N-acetylglucosamine transferase
MTATVLMMAGGTGGHVFPALAVAEQLRERGFDIQWLGAEGGIENRLVPAAGFSLHALSVTGVRGGGAMRKLKAPFMLLHAVWQALAVIRSLHPVLAVGFGGFASGPGGLAARLSRVPLVIHEQNAVAGLTNRWLSRMAAAVLQAFPQAFGDNAQTVGNPVRRDIVALTDPVQRYASHEGPLRVLVVGGSQGALVLNQSLPAALAALQAHQPLAIRHQCGRGREDEARTAYQQAGLDAQVNAFIDDMAGAYDWADLLVCRAGALTVSEVAAAGVAAIFVPLPSAVDDHQSQNAAWLADENAGWVLPQARMSNDILIEILGAGVSRQDLASVAQRARAMAVPDSAEQVADMCEEVLRG